MCIKSLYVCRHQKLFSCNLPPKLCKPKLLLAQTKCEKCSLLWPLSQGMMPQEQMTLSVNNQYYIYDSLIL